ncbi:hypothetical protein [Acidovorax sp.]|uniref:hypothetical protein n=1 Tax=Acidovorax sp. TaxID=1872122 RepID=UPI00391F6C99
MDEQGLIVLQLGNRIRQLLQPALLNAAQAQGIFSTAISDTALAAQPGSSDGALTVTLAGQQWLLLKQWVRLPSGADQTGP